MFVDYVKSRSKSKLSSYKIKAHYYLIYRLLGFTSNKTARQRNEKTNIHGLPNQEKLVCQIMLFCLIKKKTFRKEVTLH